MIVPLTEAQLKAINSSCQRSQAEIDQDLAILKHWLAKQPHLPKTSDAILKKFLFSLKYRVDKTKTVVDNFYSVRESLPFIFSDLDPTTESFKKINDALYMFPLPKLTKDLNRVFCYKISKVGAKEFDADGQFKRNEMLWNWVFDQDALTLGNVWIFDLENLTSLAQWSNFNLTFMKKLAKLNMDAKPVRIRKVHFVNLSPLGDTTLNFIKNFIPQKFRERLVFSASSDSLQDDYSLDMLPVEWGGKAGTMEELNQKMYEELVKNRNWFIDMQNMKADSSKRIGQSKTADDSILGIEGNFKKLDFD